MSEKITRRNRYQIAYDTAPYFYDSKNDSNLTLIEVNRLLNQNDNLIEKFLKRIDWILERIEFHTENPDSELIDEISKEYKKWVDTIEPK